MRAVRALLVPWGTVAVLGVGALVSRAGGFEGVGSVAVGAALMAGSYSVLYGMVVVMTARRVSAGKAVGLIGLKTLLWIVLVIALLRGGLRGLSGLGLGVGITCLLVAAVADVTLRERARRRRAATP